MILHVIHSLSGGGASRSLVMMARMSAAARGEEHHVLCLVPPAPTWVQEAIGAGLTVHESRSEAQVAALIQRADLVQMHFWNTPQGYAFLRHEWPAMRLLLRLNIGGNTPAQVVTKRLMRYADLCAAGTPYTLTLPHLTEDATLVEKMAVLPPAANFARLAHVTPLPHDTFNVGYIGTVDFVKMHPDFVQLAHSIDVPNVRFIVRGSGGAHNTLMAQAHRLGIADRVDVGGYVEEIGALYAQLDLFGYPLCADNYGTSDSALHEAMFAGVSPVIFAHGPTQGAVIHNHTGIVVESLDAYARAVEYLYHHPAERLRLGRNAHDYARKHFGAENSVRVLHHLYDQLLQQPKRVRRWEAVKIAPPFTVGAHHFIESLGPFGEFFQVSLHAQEHEAVLEADRMIAAASAGLLNPGGGGLFHYRAEYPQDGFLHLWTALVLHQQGHIGRALVELKAAMRCGCDDWRVRHYRAEWGAQAVYRGSFPLTDQGQVAQ